MEKIHENMHVFMYFLHLVPIFPHDILVKKGPLLLHLVEVVVIVMHGWPTL